MRTNYRTSIFFKEFDFFSSCFSIDSEAVLKLEARYGLWRVFLESLQLVLKLEAWPVFSSGFVEQLKFLCLLACLFSITSWSFGESVYMFVGVSECEYI
jgi:hypothetical protein